MLAVAAAVVVAVAGFYAGRRLNTTIETGEVHSQGDGGGSILTPGWTYGFGRDVTWLDDRGSWHESDTPDCLPPLSVVKNVRFAWAEVTVQGTTWRPVVWVDCSSVPAGG